MPATGPNRSLITLLRDSTRAVALVLALFVAGFTANVACADHDLADVGIGQHQSHMPAPDSSPPGSSATHLGGHCCHAGGLHAPALLTTAAFLPFDPEPQNALRQALESLLPDPAMLGGCRLHRAKYKPGRYLTTYHEPVHPSAMDHRELRPPIL